MTARPLTPFAAETYSTELRVALVEPDETLCDQLQSALAQAGGGLFQISVARTMDEALAQPHARSFDVMLVDLSMPDADPARAVQRARESCSRCAVIALTRRDRQSAAVAAVHAGAQDFLIIEQLTVDALGRTIFNAVERQRMLEQLNDRMHRLEAEEARFRMIVHGTTDGIVILDQEGQIKFANPAAERLFGRSARELIESPFGFPVVIGATTEIDVVRNDGTMAVAELRVAHSEWEGQPAALVSLRDITERRLIEERERSLMHEQAARAEAEASERRSRFLAEAGSSLADSLDHRQTLRRLAELAVPFLADWCIVDVLEREGSIQRIAVAHADPDKSEIARALSGFVPDPSSLLGAARALRTRTAELIPDVTDNFIRRLSGRSDYYEALKAIQPRSALIVPLVARGRALGTIALISAESGRRYTQRDSEFVEELARRAAIAVDNARLYQEAQAANKAKADFLAVMSHELRTPLNAVIGYSDLLLMGVPVHLPGLAKNHVQRIRSSARHLLRLIEEILTYARMEAGREELNLEHFDANELVRDVLTIIEPLAHEKSLTVRATTPKDPIRLHTDAGKLQQILINLLTNAVKFTESGEVGITFGFDGGMAQFTVWDTGIGIQPNMLARIFEPFWQAEQSRTRRAEGTGLGLTVARRLARLLGGDIEARSTLGVGSQFVVRVAPSLTRPV